MNAYYRKHGTLDGCPHLSPENLEKLKADMVSGWHYEKKPFQSWELSNNNAEIRRIRQRIDSLTRAKETVYVGWEFDGGHVEANREQSRLQVFFEDKPDADARQQLKEHGFRWAPSVGAWQRLLNGNAYYAADRIPSIQPLTGEKPTELQRSSIREQQAQMAQAQAEPEEYIYQVHANPRSDSRENLYFLQAYIPQGDGTAKIGDVLYIGTPEKCRELLEQLNTGELTQEAVKELYAKEQEQPQEPAPEQEAAPEPEPAPAQETTPEPETAQEDVPAAEPQAGREWGFYVIADLKTWATNAEQQSPIEHFDTFEEAKARFDELRGQPYNKEAEDLNADGRPYAHLTLGMESKDGMSAVDILHVRAGKKYLVDDFTRMERLRDDPVVLESLSRVAKEIGFDRVRPYVQENGSYKAMPDMPFSQWENPYFAVDPPEPGDTFSIYQVPAGPEGRDIRFRSYEELQAAGLAVDRKNYELVYTAPLDGKTTLENIYRTFNIDDRPADFRGHSLSVSDVVVINRGGKEEAHYCDSIGFTPVPEFMQESPIKTAEMSTEQNYNMIDGTLNNAPSMGELEARAKAGEQISLFDVAEAAKAEDKKPKQTRTASKTGQRQKKPSIRAQLKAAKEEQAKKPPQREKSKELEV